MADMKACTGRRSLRWSLPALFVAALVVGCGDDSSKPGAVVQPDEGQKKAQSNMEDFMKKSGKMPAAK